MLEIYPVVLHPRWAGGRGRGSGDAAARMRSSLPGVSAGTAAAPLAAAAADAAARTIGTELDAEEDGATPAAR